MGRRHQRSGRALVAGRRRLVFDDEAPGHTPRVEPLMELVEQRSGPSVALKNAFSCSRNCLHWLSNVS